MSAASSYLDGFLAAARPSDRTADVLPSAPPPPVEGTPAQPISPVAELSWEEETKRRLHPLDSFVRLLDCVASNRPPDAEDRFRFQWFGLFYQAPAQDAFTLRLRLPGGRLYPFQLAGLAEITQRFAAGQVVLNSQGGLDVPGVPVRSADKLLYEVERIGLSARRTGGDCVQAIRGGEYDGIKTGLGHAPIYPLVCALEQAVSYASAFGDLPRPCEVVLLPPGVEIVGASTADTLLLYEVTNGEPLGGTATESTVESTFLFLLPGHDGSGFLLPRAQVIPSCLAVLRDWASNADRSSREHASLSRYLGELEPGALLALLRDAKPVSLSAGCKSGTVRLTPGISVPRARLLTSQLIALERCCCELNWHEVRLAHGGVYPAGLDGEWIEAGPILEHALSV